MKDAKNLFPPGWDEERVREVIEYYDSRTDDELAEEIEAAFKDKSHTFMAIPNELVPAVRTLLSKHDELAETATTLASSRVLGK